MRLTMSRANRNAKASAGNTSAATITLARLLSASIPATSPEASRRLMLGRNTWLTDWRQIDTSGPITAATENAANWWIEKIAAATHWSAWLLKPNNAPEKPNGAAYFTCPLN